MAILMGSGFAIQICEEQVEVLHRNKILVIWKRLVMSNDVLVLYSFLFCFVFFKILISGFCDFSFKQLSTTFYMLCIYNRNILNMLYKLHSQ